MESLKNKYTDQPCQIIGNGPSIHHLTSQWISPYGPVITLNRAVERVELLSIRNPIYSMQKDGGERRHGKNWNMLTPECDHRGDCGEMCGGMVRPKNAALLLHEHESKYCFEDYHTRHIFAWDSLGLPQNEFSLLCAVQIAGYMGCSELRIICCDVHATGDVGGAQGVAAWLYREQVQKISPYLEQWKHEFFTPEA